MTQRCGPRPRTTTVIPHSQIDQQPDDATHLDAVLGEALTWPGVRGEASGISVPGAQALVLDDESATGPDEAFLVGREFCHGHAQGDFSLHMALPLDLAAEAERNGWAEPHLYVRTGQVPANLVLIYAPRDDTERGVVTDLVRASYDFASAARPVTARTGESGMGAYHSRVGFEAFSHRTSVLRKPTRPDLPVQYPPYGKWKSKVIRKAI